MMPLTDIGWLVLLCGLVFFSLGLVAARWGKKLYHAIRWTFIGRRRLVHRGTLADYCRSKTHDAHQEGTE